MSNSTNIDSQVEFCEVGFNSDYRVGTDGSVWSKAKCGPASGGSRESWTPLKTKSGFVTITLWDGTRKPFDVDKLVLRTFKGDHRNKKSVRHLNGDKSDNRLDNLEWCSQSDLRRQSWKEPVGEARLGSKLKSEQVLEIRRRLSEENETLTNLASDYGVDATTILAIRDRKTWRHI